MSDKLKQPSHRRERLTDELSDRKQRQGSFPITASNSSTLEKLRSRLKMPKTQFLPVSLSLLHIEAVS